MYMCIVLRNRTMKPDLMVRLWRKAKVEFIWELSDE